MFEEMLIIPGMELDVKPGVHLLLLFDPSIKPEKIDEFLEENGYEFEKQGVENPSNINLEILDALEKVAELGGFGIGAHVDSEKGIYNVLRDGGQYRAQILKSKYLLAVQYNNPRIPSKIQTILNNREYRRDYPLSFIQCSDYHGDENLGEPITYIKMNEMTFKELCNSLQNYNECVSATERPEIKSILDKIIKEHNTIILEDITNENISPAIESVCALLNNGNGNLVIGAVNQNIIGTNIDNKQSVELIERIKKAIKNHNGFNLDLKVYPYGVKSVLVIKCKPINGNIFYLAENNKAFILQNGNATEANAEQIASIVERNILDRLEVIQEINKPNTKDLINKVDALINCSSYINLITTIERMSINLTKVVKPSFVQPLEGETKTKVIDTMLGIADNVNLVNGSINGRIVVVGEWEPRLSYSYVRCSCPKYDIKELELDKIKGPLIIIAPGGGTFLLDREEEISIVSAFSEVPVLYLRFLEGISSKLKITEKYLIGWLKSSLAIWYSLTAWGSYDLRKINIFKKIPIPIFEDSSIVEAIEVLIEAILKEENDFLSIVNTVSKDEAKDIVNSHNNSINNIAAQIDSLFYEAFCVTDKQVSIINTALGKNELFVLTP